ncbi:MAG TPA: Ig-like domain-containing protein, partial [Nocardioides sp.]
MTFLLTRRCARGPADGRWSLVPSAPLAQGARVLAVRQSDAVQNTSPTSSLTVLVDTSAPAAVRVDAPADGAAVPTAAPVVTGAGEPGARVEVSVDGAEARQVLVDASGRWTLTTAAPLTDGSHVLIVRQVDPAGNVSPTTSHSFTVDTVAPDAPVVTTPRDGATLDATRPAVAGTSEAGATLTLTVDGASAGTTVVTAGGTWSLTPAAALVDGARTLGATQTDRAGHT